MKIASRLKSLLPVWFAAACLLNGPAAEAAGPPNVVVVMIDDLGAADLACYGNRFHETPHIDRLADQGIRFTAAYAAAPVCSPTRAAFMTGKHPARLGMTIWHEAAASGPNQGEKLLPPECVANLPRTEVTLAERLQQAGYRTYHVGKWHLGDARHYPETQGFEVNLGGTLWGMPATFFWPYRGRLHEEFRYVPGLDGGRTGEYLTDRLTSEAIRLVESTGDGPFFLNLCFHSVHTPIEAKDEPIARFRAKASDHQEHAGRNATYAAMIHSVDENIGRLIAALERTNKRNDTLLIVASDNGGVVHDTRWGKVTTNGPLRSGKGSLYEGGVRVPLIVAWPGKTPPATMCADRVVTHDLFPTILQAAGVQNAAPPEEVDGLSMMKLLEDPTATLGRAALYWHYPHYYPTTTPVSSVLRGDMKLLHFYEDDQVELYDLKASPGEQVDLSTRDPATTRQLQADLRSWLKKVGARMPRNHPTRP